MSLGKNDKWNTAGTVNAADLIEVQDGGVGSRTLIKRKTGNVTVFAFDAGEGLSEHTTPFDALLLGLDGDGEITISGTQYKLTTGDLIRLPAGEPHAVSALTPFKMLLIMIRE